MKKIIFAALAMAAMPLAAQETYELGNLSATDLNGTARYVGMGGAMEALGADISTTSTNPAGVGLFRRSQVSTGISLVSQEGEQGFATANKTNVSFDHIGFVYASRSGENGFFNFAFNYRKSRNFDQILSITDALGGASQSKLTLDKFANGVVQDANDQTYNQVDVLYNELLYDNEILVNDPNGGLMYNDNCYAFSGDQYTYNRGNAGYVGDFDINLSGNINNRVYLGFTLGIHDVNYRGYYEYGENMQPNPHNLDYTVVADQRYIDGTGVDGKFGVIFRPVEASPFRIGAYIHTPTYYNLTASNATTLYLNNSYTQSRSENLDYVFKTPWHFGASLGHTVGTNLALGATIDFADYGSTDARVMGDTHYSWWEDDYYTDTMSDTEMNKHIKNTLKGVTTIKLGAEYKPADEVAVRVGYNYVAPMYQETADRDVTVWSLGNMNSSSTDYTNWKSTNRFTLGLGFNLDKNWKLDLAYQYSMQKGDFYPFLGSADDNRPYMTEVKNNRNQWMMTASYSF